jgi:hypothetical protein
LALTELDIDRHSELEQAVAVVNADLDGIYEIRTFVPRLNGRRRELRLAGDPRHRAGQRLPAIRHVNGDLNLLPEADRGELLFRDVGAHVYGGQVRDCVQRLSRLNELPGLDLAADYKSCRDATPEAVSRAIRDYSYHQQDAFYTDGIWAALDPADVRFVFAFQSKTAPYLITVRELAQQDRDIGRARNQRALRLYADCQRTGIWPDWTGPVTEIPQISMPSYDTIRQAEEYLG